MILQQGVRNETFGLPEQKSFSIKASAHAFKILSDGLYSDKITSIIRELSCNAYDSHVANGNPETPFKIGLPTKIDPFFYIRDFGTGLSVEDVMTLYTTYFESTKGESNDFIGALGLGSKSPFSYTDSFTVDSWFEGTKYSYCIFIGEQGVPTIARLSEEPSEEPSGLKISIEVRPDDIEKFIDKAQLLLEFNPVPEINIELKNKNPYEVIYKGTGYELRDLRTYNNVNIYFKQGFILYPLDQKKFDIKGLEFPTFSSSRISVIIDIELGKLSFTASRESIAYDEITIKNIKEALETTVTNFKEDIKNYWKEVSKDKQLYSSLKDMLASPFKVLSSSYKEFVKVDDTHTLYDIFNYVGFEKYNIDYLANQVDIGMYFLNNRRRSYTVGKRQGPADGFYPSKNVKILIQNTKNKPAMKDLSSYLLKEDCQLLCSTEEFLPELLRDIFSQEDVVYTSDIIPAKIKTDRAALVVGKQHTIKAYYRIGRNRYSKELYLTTKEIKELKGYFISVEQNKEISSSTLDYIVSKLKENDELLFIMSKNFKHSLKPISEILDKNIKDFNEIIIQSAFTSKLSYSEEVFFSNTKIRKLLIKIIPELKHFKPKSEFSGISYRDSIYFSDKMKDKVVKYEYIKEIKEDINKDINKVIDTIKETFPLVYPVIDKGSYAVQNSIDELEFYIQTKMAKLKKLMKA